MATAANERTLQLQVREDDQTPGVVRVLAVPFGETLSMWGGMFHEEVSPDVTVQMRDSQSLPIIWRHDEVIGSWSKKLVHTDQGLEATGRISDTTLGRDVLTLLRDQASTGASIGFRVIDSHQEKRGDVTVDVLDAIELLEISLTPIPAYSQARVLSVREQNGDTMPTAPAAETPIVDVGPAVREAIDPLVERLDQLEARAFTTDSPGDPLAQYRSIGEVAQAVQRGDVDERALTVNVTGDNPGLFMGSALTMEVQGIVQQRTRVLNAFGTVPLPAKGMTLDWPRNDTDLSAVVETQAAQGDELNSVAISFTKDSTNVVTQGAAFRNAWQLLRRSEPEYLTQQLRVAYAAWAYQMEKNTVTAVVGLTGLSTVDYAIGGSLTIDGVLGALIDATFAVEDATGATPDVMFAPRAVFKNLALLEDTAGNKVFPYISPNTNAQGQSRALAGVLDVNGVACIPSPHATANSLFVGHSSAFKVGGGTVNLVSGDVPQNLVTDTAVWGEYAMADYQPSGIVRIYDVP